MHGRPGSRRLAARRRPDRRRLGAQRPGRSPSAARTSAAGRTRASRTSGSAARATSRATTGSGSRPAGERFGPAARCMDRFAIEVDARGVLTIDTSAHHARAAAGRPRPARASSRRCRGARDRLRDDMSALLRLYPTRLARPLRRGDAGAPRGAAADARRDRLDLARGALDARLHPPTRRGSRPSPRLGGGRRGPPPASRVARPAGPARLARLPRRDRCRLPSVAVAAWQSRSSAAPFARRDGGVAGRPDRPSRSPSPATSPGSSMLVGGRARLGRWPGTGGRHRPWRSSARRSSARPAVMARGHDGRRPRDRAAASRCSSRGRPPGSASGWPGRLSASCCGSSARPQTEPTRPIS